MKKIKYTIKKVNKNIKDDLNSFLKIPSVHSNLIALPDIHLKRGEMSPTGCVLISRNEIIPSFTHLAVGSGMSAWIIKNIDEKKKNYLNKAFKVLKKNIPGKSKKKKLKYLPNFINKNFLHNSLIFGAETLKNKKILTASEIQNIENNGNFLKGINFKKNEVIDAIPSELIKRCFNDFGTLGTGNTFIELHEVKNIFNSKISNYWNINQKDHILFLHSGCGEAYLNLYYTPRWGVRGKNFLNFEKEKWLYHYKSLFDKNTIQNKLNFFPGSSKYFSINYDTHQGKIYYLAINALTNLSLVNRLWLGKYTNKIIKKFIKGDIKSSLLWDSVHDSIQIYNKSKDIIHRHGGAHVSFDRKDFNLNYKKTGSPIIFPGSAGQSIDILKPEKNIRYLHNSFCHGVGRKIDRPSARKKFNNVQAIKEIKKSGAKLFFSKTNFSGEHPKSFKNKSIILKNSIKNKYCSRVLNTKPLLIFKS